MVATDDTGEGDLDTILTLVQGQCEEDFSDVSTVIVPNPILTEEETTKPIDGEKKPNEALADIATQIIGETLEQNKFLIIENIDPTSGLKLSEIVKHECLRAGDHVEIVNEFYVALAMIEQGYNPSIVIVDIEQIKGLSNGFYQMPTEQLPIGSLRRSGAEVIITTTIDNKPKAVTASLQGANSIVTKPIAQYELRIAIERILKERRNSRIIEGISQTALKDKLTGLFNRRYLEHFFDEEVKRVKSSGGSMSLLMIDIDHFKNWNDTFGHDIGDQVLEKLSNSLMRYSRDGRDVAARYGGEEFIVLYPNSNAEQALIPVNRFVNRLKNKVMHEKDNQKFYVTVSGGLVTFNVNDGIESAYQSRQITPQMKLPTLKCRVSS